MKVTMKGSHDKQLDATLCRIVGDFGSAMKHAHRLGNPDLYEQMRDMMVDVADLRDRLRIPEETETY